MPAPDPQALERAAAAVRRVVANIRKTQAPTELLAEAEQQLDALSEKLAAYDHPGPYAQGALVAGDIGEIPDGFVPSEFFPYSPVVGASNPVAPPIYFENRDGELFAEHAFDAQYCGPLTGVHGGVIAMVLDELLGSVNVVNDVGGFTGTLSIKYHSLTPVGLDKPIRMRAWVDRREGRKTFSKGTFHFGNRLCAEAEGVFIMPNDDTFERMRDEVSE
ncbi:MAG: PaaI family thioesterase [Myxococcota bacterium]|nr:PaaI family thioesterase [Myxococcota bacterium]